jgi:hypothetical protein
MPWIVANEASSMSCAPTSRVGAPPTTHTWPDWGPPALSKL